MDKIKNALLATWNWIKNTALWLWSFIKPYAKYALGVLLVIIALIGTIAFVRNHNKDNKETTEVAQVYEPSIGAPLPPDTPEKNENVEGATTAEPAFTPPTVAPTSGVDIQEQFTAPHTGIDDTEPVTYTNEVLRFEATLPARTKVQETGDGAIFTNKDGALLYSVSVVRSSDSLQEVERQLRQSPTVKSARETNYRSIPALQLRIQNAGVGMVISKNGFIYYVIGYQQLDSFEIQ